MRSPPITAVILLPKVEVTTVAVAAPPRLAADRDMAPRSTLHMATILVALFLSLLVAALEATVVATAAPVIAHELGSAPGYTWIGGAYLLADAAGSPIWAQLSDIWGRRAAVLAALLLFFVASVICALAHDMETLIAGRAVQGAAGGGLIMLVHVVISDLFSLRRRSLWMGMTEGVWAVAGACGPPLGGFCASVPGWRWCFYINLPICGLAFGLVWVALDVRHERTGLWTGLRAIDWWGLSSFVAFVVMVLLGLDLGGTVLPWTSAKVMGLIVVGATMFGVFLWIETCVARHPLMPVSLFCDTSNLASLGVGFCHGCAYIPGQYYIPLYLQAVRQASPVQSGLFLAPLIVATALTGIVSGVVIHRTGKFRELIWAGTSTLCLASGLCILLEDTTSVGLVLLLTMIFGCGSGLLFEPPLIAVQSRCCQEDLATATSTFTFCRSIALAMSIVIGGVIFQHGMDGQSHQLAQSGLPADLVAKLSGKEAAANAQLARMLSDPVQKRTVAQAFARAISKMWYAYVALAALGICCGMFVGKAGLSAEHTETVTGIKHEPPGQTLRG